MKQKYRIFKKHLLYICIDYFNNPYVFRKYKKAKKLFDKGNIKNLGGLPSTNFPLSNKYCYVLYDDYQAYGYANEGNAKRDNELYFGNKLKIKRLKIM